MPVVPMTPEDVDQWLNGKNVADAIEWQKPPADEAIQIVEMEKAA